MQQHYHNFGFTTEQQRQPFVRAPVRRQYRSRTPVREGTTTAAQPTTTAIPHYSNQQQTLPAPTDLPPTQPPTTATTAHPQQHTEVINIDDDNETQDVGDQAPTTPIELVQQYQQELAAASPPTTPRLTPSKRPPPDPTPGETPQLHPEASGSMDQDIGQQTTPHTTTDTHTQSTAPHSTLNTNKVTQFNVANTTTTCKQSASSTDNIETRPTCTQHSTTHWQQHTLAPLIYHDEGITLADRHFDGTEDVYMPQPCTTYFTAYQASNDYEGDGMSDDTDASQDDMRTSPTTTTGNHHNENGSVNEPKLTRQQQKALDKEIPWRTIVDRGGNYLQAFVDAAKSEEKSWMQ